MNPHEGKNEYQCDLVIFIHFFSLQYVETRILIDTCYYEFSYVSELRRNTYILFILFEFYSMRGGFPKIALFSDFGLPCLI